MSDNGQIIWEDPPPRKTSRGGPDWTTTLTPLMEHPNRWARVREGTENSLSTMLHRLRHRRNLSYPAGRWEFVQRRLDSNGKSGLYARYLGPDEDDQP